mgnify:CR=1 FL=1
MVQEEITLEALEAQPKDTYLLVDIRDEAAFQFGHMDGAVHIPANELPERHAELPKDQLLVIYCRSGIISEDAAAELREDGFSAVNLVGGYVQWLLACLKITPFTGMTCVIITVICCLGSILYGIKCKNRITNSLPWEQTTLVYREEILFFLVFLFWTYLAGFHPAAHGTEKYMDFGFMQSMMRSTTLPAQDMWFAGKSFNYYYGGQYLAVFLTKLTGTSVEITYNLMRTMVAAFAFVLVNAKLQGFAEGIA